MPKRFDSGVFDPERAELMKRAFAEALAQVKLEPEDETAAKHHLAGAIVELVSAGVSAHDELVSKALISLASAKVLSGEWMIRRPEPKSNQ